MELSEIISEYLKKEGKSQRQLAKDSGITPSYLGKIVNGKMKNPSQEILTKLAFGMAIPAVQLALLIYSSEKISNELSRSKIARIAEPYKVPFLDDSESIDSKVLLSLPECWKSDTKRFVIEMKDDSLDQTGIHPGDLLVFDKKDEVEKGKIGCFLVNKKKLIRILKTSESGNIILDCVNPSYEPIIETDNMKITVLGELRYQMTQRK